MNDVNTTKTPLKTILCQELELEYPIVQAPIGSGTCPDLAAAVSNAGGLGMLSVTWRDIDETRAVIQETQAATNRPFGVNIVVDPSSKRVPTDKHLEVCLNAGIDIVSLSFGEAAPYIDRIHEAGGIVMQTVGSATEARDAVTEGVDIVVAQGWEAGGHVQSDVATLPLVPRVVDAVKGTPVVAAGGIADGRGVAAALVLGASGAWLGTRFVATREAALHPMYKQQVVDATETEAIHTDVFDVGWSGVPHRVLRNETTEHWEAAGRPPPGSRPNEDEIVAEFPNGQPIPRYSFALPRPGMSGRVEELALYAGQSVGLTETLKSAEDVVAELVSETTKAIQEVSTTMSAGE